MENNDRATIDLFKALGDESRLAIVRMLMTGESYVELIASRLNLTSATVSHHLKKLETAGLVECHRTQFYRVYSLRREVLDATLAALIGTLPPQDDDTQYKQAVIDAFFEYGKLKTIPAQRKKREVVLRYILEGLDDGKRYSEAEINTHIARYHEDYCTIRREMIACGLMTREHDLYTLTPKQA